MKKMYIKTVCLLMAAATVSISSCKSDLIKKNDKTVITERIQYDVFMKNPDEIMEPWVQNMEKSKRESFAKMIMDKVYSKEVKIYDNFTNDLTTVDKFNALYNRTDTVSLQRPDPPYEYYDTVMKREFGAEQIVKMRFMEEWYMDKNTLEMEKKIVGIAPIIENYGPDGEIRGYTPIFWIYFDERYPEIITGK